MFTVLFIPLLRIKNKKRYSFYSSYLQQQLHLIYTTAKNKLSNKQEEIQSFFSLLQMKLF